MRAIIILAGGRSSRFGTDKSLLDFAGKPLITQAVHRLQGLGDEYIVSIGKNQIEDNYRRILPTNTSIVQDKVDFQGPLAGFITALEKCKSNTCFLTACDMPTIEPKVVEFLFQKIDNSSGAVPKWRDGRIEPLHAVYDSNTATRAARQVAGEKIPSMISMIDRMLGAKFVSIEDEVSPLNPMLNTFRNLNTPRDLRELEKNYLG